MIAILVLLASVSHNPPGTLITVRASCGDAETLVYMVVASPIAEKVGPVYVCGSWKGDPLPGMKVRFVSPVSPGVSETFEGWALIGGFVLIGNTIVDPRSIPP